MRDKTQQFRSRLNRREVLKRAAATAARCSATLRGLLKHLLPQGHRRSGGNTPEMTGARSIPVGSDQR